MSSEEGMRPEQSMSGVLSLIQADVLSRGLAQRATRLVALIAHDQNDCLCACLKGSIQSIAGNGRARKRVPDHAHL
jgi:hypothetical protein